MNNDTLGLGLKLINEDTKVQSSTVGEGSWRPETKGDFRRIAIIGTADSMQDAPYEDKDFEIWGLGVDLTHKPFKRWDLIFEMHQDDYINRPEIIDRLNNANCPVYMRDVHPKVPKSIKYPLDEVSEGYHKNFTNSVVYMIALAVYEHKLYHNVGHIAVFGVHMQGRDEYVYQRPACEYWLGIAEANGISVHVGGKGSVLACTSVYGYEGEWKIVGEASQRREQLAIGQKQIGEQISQLQQQYYKQVGAIEDCDYWIKRYQ